MENASDITGSEELRRALVIDADEMMHSLIRNYLSKIGVHQVVCVKDGDAAMVEIREGRFQLIILDWKHKNPPGAQLFAQIRAIEEVATLPIVLISGKITVQDVEVIKNDRGNSTFLAKPFTQEILEGVVKKAIRKGGIVLPGAGKPHKQKAGNVTPVAGSSQDSGLYISKGQGIQGVDLQVARGQSKANGGHNLDKGVGGPQGNGTYIDKGKGQAGLGLVHDKGVDGPEGNGIYVDKGKGQAGLGLVHDKGVDGPEGNGTYVDKGKGQSGLGLMQDKGPGQSGKGLMHDQGPGHAGDGGFVDERPPGNQGFTFRDKKENSSLGTAFDMKVARDDKGNSKDDFSYESKAQGSPTAQGAPDALEFGNNDLKATNSGKSAVADSSGHAGAASERRSSAAASELAGLMASDQLGEVTRTEGENGAIVPNERGNGVGIKPGEDLSYAREDKQGSEISFAKELKIRPSEIQYEQKESKTTNPVVQLDSEGVSANPGFIASALVIDSDPAFQYLFKSYLEQRGVKKVTLCDTSEAGWRYFQEMPFDIVIMDWRLKEMSGLCLFNRIRRSSRGKVKILVSTGFVKKEDFRLLEESSFTRLLEKPFQLRTLDKIVTELNDEQKRIVAVSVEINKQLRSMGEMDVNLLARQILRHASDPFHASMMTGEYLYKMGRLKDAEHFYLIAKKIQPRNATVFTQLGKIYHRTGRSELAYQILQGASFLSPQSVERLCLMGELGLTLQKPEEARKYFHNVLKIDKEDPVAKAGSTIADNLDEYVKESGEPLTMMFASALNILGVTLARKNRIDKAIEQYNAAMTFIHDNEDLARLKFNTGLGYLRGKQYEEAHRSFEEAVLLSGGKFQKALEYRNMIEAKYSIKSKMTTQHALAGLQDRHSVAGESNFSHVLGNHQAANHDLLSTKASNPKTPSSNTPNVNPITIANNNSNNELDDIGIEVDDFEE